MEKARFTSSFSIKFLKDQIDSITVVLDLFGIIFFSVWTCLWEKRCALKWKIFLIIYFLPAKKCKGHLCESINQRVVLFDLPPHGKVWFLFFCLFCFVLFLFFGGGGGWDCWLKYILGSQKGSSIYIWNYKPCTSSWKD